MPEYLPGQPTPPVQDTKNREAQIVRQVVHPRQARLGEIVLAKMVPYMGLGNGRYVALAGALTGEPVEGGSGAVTPTVPTSGVEHNDLAGLQGGNVNERYHITLAQLTQFLEHHTTHEVGGDDEVVPPGSDTEMLYNNAGSMGAAANARYDAGANALILTAGTKLVFNG